MLNRFFYSISISLLLLSSLSLKADQGTYLEPDQYIANAFQQEPPQPSVIWIKGDLKKAISNILGHPYHKLRVKYWEKSGRTAWILEEIGKEKYITTGIIVNAKGQVEDIKVLVFRESRGWEVKHDFFTQQFKNITLKSDTQLTKYIDGITGATLSVHALQVQARMALYLHEEIRKKKEQ